MADLFRIEIDDRDFRRGMSEMISKLTKRRPLMRMLAGIMHDAVEENFEQEGRPRWKPSLRAKKEGGKTLQKSGSLATSISEKYDNDEAVVGTNKIYARRHQLGDRSPVLIRAKKKPYLKFKTPDGRWVQKKQVKVKLPARPFLKLTDDDKDKMTQKTMEYLGKG